MAKKTARGEKTRFVLSQPPGTRARDVVEAAKGAGIDISEKYVYIVRSNAKRKARKRRGRPPGRPPRAASEAGDKGDSQEIKFRRMLVELGLVKAEQLLAETKSKLVAAIS
jgi:hypothetical protein